MKDINPKYRYHKLWITIGCLLIVLVIYFSVITKLPPPSSAISYLEHSFVKPFMGRSSSLWLYFDKWTHLLAYFVLMAWFAQIYHIKKQRKILALLFVVMGLVLEIIQTFEFSRQLEFLDIVANCSGVLIALLITKRQELRMLLLKIESYI